MKLAFNGQAHYPDFSDGYDLYARRNRTTEIVDKKTYGKVIRLFCKRLADRLEENGFVDLPCGLGMIAAVTIGRKPQYRGKKYIGYGKYDWETKNFDGSTHAFGITYLPQQKRNGNLRCLGFVANRRLFRRVKEKSERDTLAWRPLVFNDEMI